MTNDPCPKCGTHNQPGSSFCEKCGSPLLDQSSGEIPSPTPYKIYGAPLPTPPRKNKNKNLIIGVALVIVLVVVIGAIAAVVLNGNSDDGGSIFGDTSMTVSKVRPYTSFSSLWQPEDGKQYVIVYLNYTNGYSSDVNLNPYYFNLIGSDGLSYSYTWGVDNNMSDYALSGTTSPVVIAFEIPSTVTPASIEFAGVYTMHSCSVSLTSAWSTTPILGPTDAALNSVSYSETISGYPYITPEIGNRFINVTVTITNLKSSELSLAGFDFTLYTSDGLTHNPTYLPDMPDVPSGLQAGVSATIYLGFEISEAAEPTMLEFDDWSYFTTI